MFTKGPNEISSRPLCYLDFNGDLLLDLLVLNDQKLTLLLNTKSDFEPLFSLNLNSLYQDFICADFDGDGRIDFIAIQKVGNDVTFVLYKQRENAFVNNGSVFRGFASTFPFVADIFGELKPTLVGYNSLNAMMTADYVGGSFIFKPLTLKMLEKETSFPTGDCLPIHPHSNAFVDLNGDCLADLFITCKRQDQLYLQVYVNQKDNGFVKYKDIPLPSGTGPIRFADMNVDGTIDLVFPTCSQSKCAIHILHNSQIPVCKGKRDVNCRPPSNLCTPDDNFSLDLESPENHVVFDMKQLMLPTSVLVTQDSSFDGVLPIAIHLGDVNKDGYPDILLSTKASGKDESVELLMSVPCDYNCLEAAKETGKRYFFLVKDSFPQLGPQISASFMDFNNDGALDIFLLYKNTKYGLSTMVLQNKLFNDAFFYSSLGSCSDSENARPYGVNYAGATTKTVVVDTDGGLRISASSQLPQQAYLSLISPRNVNGIGRTNNYIENIYVGVSKHSSSHSTSYPGIIPNSAIVISPHQPAEEQINWQLELYMNPSSTTFTIIIVLTSILGILGVILSILERKEYQEDEAEKRQHLHSINFDAL